MTGKIHNLVKEKDEHLYSLSKKAFITEIDVEHLWVEQLCGGWDVWKTAMLPCLLNTVLELNA